MTDEKKIGGAGGLVTGAGNRLGAGVARVWRVEGADVRALWEVGGGGASGGRLDREIGRRWLRFRRINGCCPDPKLVQSVLRDFARAGYLVIAGEFLRRSLARRTGDG